MHNCKARYNGVTRMELPEGYELRKEQVDFIECASDALKARQVFFADAACGVGKSLAALLTVIPLTNDHTKLIICFRTRSQLAIYLKELKALKNSQLVICLANKQSMCPNEELKRNIVQTKKKRLPETELKERISKIPYKVFLNACAIARDSKTCDFCNESEEAIAFAQKCSEALDDPIIVSEKMAKRKMCAYEALKHLIPNARIFLGTYHYVFDDVVSKRVFPNGFSNTFLIIDEAHNLPNFARENLSDKISSRTVIAALKECSLYPNPSYHPRDCLLPIRDYFDRMDRFLSSGEMELFTLEQMERLIEGHNSEKVLHAFGTSVLKKKKALGEKNYTSYCLRIGEFIEHFNRTQKPNYLHTVEKAGEILRLSSYCLDARELTDRILKHSLGAILMSGSLSPLEVYRDLLLFSPENTMLATYPNPFPASNRLILTVRGISSKTSRRGEEMNTRISEFLTAIANANKGNVAAFFTSYQSMEKIREVLKTQGRRCLIEDKKTQRSTVVKQLEETDNNILLGVMGGKLSEGIDYPKNALTCVAIVGLPYALWSMYQKTLIRYFSELYPGRGPLYAYHTPALLRVIQTSGRVHRTPKDKGCIVFMEDRLQNLTSLLPVYVQKEAKVVTTPEECSLGIKNFWEHIC